MGKYIQMVKYMMYFTVPVSAVVGILVIWKFNKEAKAGKALHESEPEV